MNELVGKTVAELRDGLRAKKFSSLEITEAFLKVTEEKKDLNCYIEVTADKARTDAKRADEALARGEKGLILGVPIGLKDIISTKGIKTTCASKMLSQYVPPYDATVAAKVGSAGGVLIGKQNMDEFAMGSSNENSFFGVVKNPWDLSRVPGGTSGGSAAAVAARIIPASLGTDTGGSVRQPASYCNVVGLKPTYGRVSRYGVVAYASSLDQVGVLTRTVRDCAIVTEVISGKCAHDSTSVDIPVPNFEASIGKDIKGLRIGIPKEYFIKGLNPDVDNSVRKALAGLEAQGAKLVEISLPNTEHSVAVYYIIAPAEMSSNLSRYDGIRYGFRAEGTTDLKSLYCQTRAQGFGKEVKRRILVGTHVLSTGYYDAYYVKAQKVRSLIKKDFTDAFKDHCDIVAAPVVPTTAFKIGEKINDPLSMYLEDILTLPVNLAGLPGMSVPCGFDSKGLPIGLQLIGKPFDEETLFRVGHVHESINDSYKKIAPNAVQ
jgi:aspartyl-tRNA(Asn)/glutamyl-tRNA(Gln) amidotransferase subunit A